MMVHDRGIRPHLDDVKPEARALGLDGAMWDVVQRSWKQDPQERWTAMELSEKLFKLRKFKPAPKSAQTSGSEVSALKNLGGKSVSADPSFPPPGHSPFLREVSPKPLVSEPPSTVPLPSVRQLPQESPRAIVSNIPPPPSTMPPAPPNDTTPTVIAPVQSTLDQSPKPIQSIPASTQGRASKAVHPNEAMQWSPASHFERPHVAHANTTPAYPGTFDQAVTAASRSETIPKPLSQAGIDSSMPPRNAGPGLVSPLWNDRVEGQPQLRQFTSPMLSKSTSHQLLVAEGASSLDGHLDGNVAATLAATSRPKPSSYLAPPPPLGRVQGIPRTVPVQPKTLPPVEVITRSASGGPRFESTPAEEDSPPSSGEQTPSPPLRNIRYSGKFSNLPEEPFEKLFNEAYARNLRAHEQSPAVRVEGLPNMRAPKHADAAASKREHHAAYSQSTDNGSTHNENLPLKKPVVGQTSQPPPPTTSQPQPLRTQVPSRTAPQSQPQTVPQSQPRINMNIQTHLHATAQPPQPQPTQAPHWREPSTTQQHHATMASRPHTSSTAAPQSQAPTATRTPRVEPQSSPLPSTQTQPPLGAQFQH